jgi:DNA-binding MarR family transcriptional regulator
MTDDLSVEERLYHHFQTIYVLLDDGDKRTFKQLDLTFTQYNFLRALDAADTDSLTVSEAAKILLCTRGNITRLVKRLEKSGLVYLGNDAHDQRLVRISLSAEGQAVFEQAHQLHNNSIQRRMAAFTPEQRQQLIELTATAVQLLQADLATETT